LRFGAIDAGLESKLHDIVLDKERWWKFYKMLCVQTCLYYFWRIRVSKNSNIKHY
jgi:hypothetical protein